MQNPAEPPRVEDLLEQNLSAVLGYVRLRAGPLIRKQESCADIVQSVCREVLEDADGFEYRGPEAFRKWLFKRVLTKIVDRQRYYLRNKRDVRRAIPISALQTEGIQRLYASMYSPSQAAAAREDLERFERAFDTLSEEHQRIIVAAKLMEMSHAEIAEEFGRTPEASRVLLNRALVKVGLAMATDRSGKNGST